MRRTSHTRVLAVSSDDAALSAFAAAARTATVDMSAEADLTAAVKRLERDDYRLALIDADTLGPGTSAFVATLRQDFPHLVLLVTATDPQTPLLLDMIHSGIYDFASKPLDTRQLETTIELVRRQNVVEDVFGDMGDKLVDIASLAEHLPADVSREVFRANEQLHTVNRMLKKHVSQLTILYQMGRDISDNDNWSDALDRFLMALVNYMQADGAALLLFSDGAGRLSARSNFQVEADALEQACDTLLAKWPRNPRATEIHSIEGYDNDAFDTCLERTKPWRLTTIPLQHRNRALGFLIIDKLYHSGQAFMLDYHFLNTIQTILGGEVANASYISELRQLGRFNHKVLDNITSGVLTTDLEGCVMFYNKRAEGMCPRLATEARLHIDELFTSDTVGPSFYKTIRGSNKDTHVLEVQYVGDHEQRFPARISITKRFDDNLNGTVLVAIFEDLTEQRMLEDEIRKNDRLRVLGQLSAGVAHEIRNPLTGIATSAEVLGHKLEGDEEKSRYIRAILDEIKRLDDIIRNLLNFARPAKPLFNSCALGEVSQRVVSLLADEARKKGVALDVKNDLDYDVCYADANQLTQVLLNMVLNSIQACGDSGKVRIALHESRDHDTSGRAFAAVDVVDNGSGVPVAVRDSLFEPFVTTKSYGTGLGLAISRKIIEEHRGKIECEFLSNGTRFTICLPIESSSAQAREM